MRFAALIPALSLALAACEPGPEPAPITDSLPFFGTGYRYMNDPCLRVGEDAFTAQFLDDAADLVGCPADTENLGVFVIDTGAVEVARRGRYILYSVPVR